MTTNTLSVEVQPEVPKVFIRGQTLEFVMELPCDVPTDHFENTTVSSQLRQIQNAGVSGKIADLTVDWEEPVTNGYIKLRFRADNTEEWPLGPAEFDVVFVKTATSKKYRSLPVKITIADGVTA